MHGLEKGVKHLAANETNAVNRQRAVSLLNDLIDDIKSGIEVWNNFLNSGNTSAAPGSFGGWAGFSIERTLFDIELQARKKASEATNGMSSMDEPIVELAYKKLDEDQDAKSAAETAIGTMEGKIDKIMQLIDTIKSTKPAKGKASKPAAKSAKTKTKAKTKAKSSSAKKSAPRKKAAVTKAAKKATKKSAKKAVKKPAKAKTTKNKNVKTKAVKKKTKRK